MTSRYGILAALVLLARLAHADCDPTVLTGPTDTRTGTSKINYLRCHWEADSYNPLTQKVWDALAVSYPTVTLLNNTSADDNIPIFFARRATEIRAVGCHCTGTCTPTIATVALKVASTGNTISPDTPLTCSANTSVVTWVPITSDADRNIAIGDTVLFDTTNTPNPATDTLTVEVEAADTLP